jgi:hypothetical protein
MGGMNAYVAATDPDWFHFLRDQRDVDEVNFWYPKPWGGRFQVLSDGQPLLFKLKKPHNHIAGGGFFKHYTELPLSLAWQTFGAKNGAPTHDAVWQGITRLRGETPRPWDDPVIGCVLLVEPFFWPEDLWIPNPPGWHLLVRGPDSSGGLTSRWSCPRSSRNSRLVSSCGDNGPSAPPRTRAGYTRVPRLPGRHR